MSSNNSPSQSSSSSPSSSPDIDSPRKLLGKQFNFVGGGIIYRCSHCRSHLALHDELISKAFHGRSGRAYLFNKVINITLGRPEDRLLSTGLHTVSDIYCIYCNESIGWFYEFAHQLTQKYKEGKYILEKQKIFQEVIHQPDQSDWKTAGEYGDIDENNNNNNNNNNTINYPIALSS